ADAYDGRNQRRRDPRNCCLYVSRAGAWRARGSASGHLGVRCCSVRNAHWCTHVRRTNHFGHACRSADQGAGSVSRPVAGAAAAAALSGKREALFTAPIYGGGNTTNVTRYDVSRDGKKFLINSERSDAAAADMTPITVILNWPALLRR